IRYPQFLFGGIADPEKPRSTKANAMTHTGAKTLIKEDIENFFPSISDDLAKRAWKYFFNYSEDVANILVKLTTYRGSTPQGWKTTGYIANLVFWNCEPKLVESLSRKGLAYSRWVDDICVSCKRKLSTSEKTQVINSIYGMMHSQGFKPKRSKHE